MKTFLFAATALLVTTVQLTAQTSAATAAPVSFISEQSQTEVLASDFTGTTVYSKDGQKLGNVVNLVFDQNGRLATAVVGVGGFLGIGEKDVAVPFDALVSDVKDNKHVFVLDVSKDQLNAAPTFKTLNAQAFSQKLADWRGKAAESWTQLKARAAQAYDQAKDKVKDEAQRANNAVNNPAPAPAPAQ